MVDFLDWFTNHVERGQSVLWMHINPILLYIHLFSHLWEKKRWIHTFPTVICASVTIMNSTGIRARLSDFFIPIRYSLHHFHIHCISIILIGEKVTSVFPESSSNHYSETDNQAVARLLATWSVVINDPIYSGFEISVIPLIDIENQV